MKFIVQMKDPDTLQDAIDEAVKSLVVDGLSIGEMSLIRESRSEQIRALCAKWFEYGEYLRVEIDTEARTCTVLSV